MFFTTRKFQEVEDFWMVNFTMATKLKEYYIASDEKLKSDFRYLMVEQLMQYLYNKLFMYEVKEDEADCPGD